MDAKEDKQITQEHILPLIKTGRGGLIRYMQKGAAVPKPNKLFQYDVLALLIVDEGSCTYLIDEKRIECTKGSMIWGFPEQERTLYERSPDLSLWVVEFVPEFLGAACTEREDLILREAHPSAVFQRRIPSGELRFIRPILTRLLDQDAVPAHDYFNAGLHYLLLHCWWVFQSTGQVVSSEAVHPAVARVVHRIREEGDLESSVAELADQAGLCTSRLIPLFQEQMGMTITEFRNLQKLERFFELYHHNGRFNMLGASLDAGFGSYAQFYRIFKAAMHQSPRDYFESPAAPGKPE